METKVAAFAPLAIALPRLGVSASDLKEMVRDGQRRCGRLLVETEEAPRLEVRRYLREQRLPLANRRDGA